MHISYPLKLITCPQNFNINQRFIKKIHPRMDVKIDLARNLATITSDHYLRSSTVAKIVSAAVCDS